MPSKSIREMSAKERKRRTLSKRFVRTVLLQSIALGLAALVLGLALHTYTVVNRYISEASSISRSAAGML